MDFTQASELTTGAAGLSWQVPNGWQQGRGAFGGLVLATLLRAIERADAGAVFDELVDGRDGLVGPAPRMTKWVADTGPAGSPGSTHIAAPATAGVAGSARCGLQASSRHRTARCIAAIELRRRVA